VQFKKVLKRFDVYMVQTCFLFQVNVCRTGPSLYRYKCKKYGFDRLPRPLGCAAPHREAYLGPPPGLVLPNREAYLVLLQISIGLSAVEHPNGLRRIYMSILLKYSSVDNTGVS
jgi:hypothetical protein